MVKVRDRKSIEKKIESFAEGGDSDKLIDKSKSKEKKFKRLTFSLTDTEDRLIDNLSLKIRTFRCNRSQVVKAALNLLATFDDKEICKLLEKQKY